MAETDKASVHDCCVLYMTTVSKAKQLVISRTLKSAEKLSRSTLI